MREGVPLTVPPFCVISSVGAVKRTAPYKSVCNWSVIGL